MSKLDIYPIDFEEKIGFAQIRQQLINACQGETPAEMAAVFTPNTDPDEIKASLGRIGEYRQLKASGLDYVSTYHETGSLISRISIEEAFLSEIEFTLLIKSLLAARSFFGIFSKEEVQKNFPMLFAMIGAVEFEKAILKELQRVMGEDGKVRDNASPDLHDIRKDLAAAHHALRKKTEAVVRSLKNSGMMSDDLQPTVRSGRMVVPVGAENKRKVKGLIHDESATGQTVFIEPAEVMEANNLIRDLEFAEQREIVRVLRLLTIFLRPFMNTLTVLHKVMAELEFIRVKAQLADQFQAIIPSMVERPFIDWINARHPLLEQSLKRAGKKIEPISIKLEGETRILLLSGPNAGGKSIALKTVALVQYMFQCGLPVPADPSSVFGIFDQIFIDIGDEQSLEDDLSTYSSHLKNMRHFLHHSGKRTLVLIDEFGTGTEPELGGAIAEAVLENLLIQKPFGVITTHYQNLKTLAGRKEGIVNGAMRFDQDNLRPTFILDIGKPGSSYAFEIATKIGLPEEVIDSAKQKAGHAKVSLDGLSTELERQKHEFEQKNRELTVKLAHYESELAFYQDLKANIQAGRKEILQKAKAEAKAILDTTNREIERTIREIKESKADKETTKKARERLEVLKKDKKGKIQQITTNAHLPEEESDLTPVNPGDYIEIAGKNTYAEVLEIKGKQALVLIGDLKSKVKTSDLIKVSKSAYLNATGLRTKQPISGRMDTTSRRAAFSPSVDLRGYRGEDAVAEVQKLMDNALLFGVHELRILHGKGDGILRKLIRNELKTLKEIASIESEHADRGGDGVTIVKLK